MSAHLIQGFFFPDQHGLKIDYEWRQIDIPSLYLYRFAGVIWPVPSDLEGLMWDNIGKSDLSEITIGGTEFKFTKQYQSLTHPNIVEYVFKKQGEIWVGEWRISKPSNPELPTKGLASCVITFVPDHFFDRVSVAKLFGKKEYL